jgi:DegV family protein with EDD domain
LTSGKSILHVSLSSGLSGTVNSARIAARDLEKEFPDQKIYVVDSLAASGGYGLLVDKLCDLRDEGKSIEEVYDWANENKKKLHHWFYSGDLTFYVRGGRVSKVSGFVGTLLKICPLLNVDYCGKLIPREKILGRRNAQKALVDKMLKFAQGGTDYNQKCFITHSDAPDEAMAVKAMVEKCFPHLDGEVNVSSIGSTIGSHSGPGTVAIYFWGTERVD